MADHAETFEPQVIGQRQRITSNLSYAVIAGHAAHAAVAALIHEHISVGRAIEPLLHGRKRTCIAKPAMQHKNSMRTPPHAVKSIEHGYLCRKKPMVRLCKHARFR